MLYELFLSLSDSNYIYNIAPSSYRYIGVTGRASAWIEEVSKENPQDRMRFMMVRHCGHHIVTILMPMEWAGGQWQHLQRAATHLPTSVGRDRTGTINLLEKKEIILRGPKVGRSYAFRLNPYFGWKGKVKNLDQYRKEKDNQETKDLKRKKQE